MVCIISRDLHDFNFFFFFFFFFFFSLRTNIKLNDLIKKNLLKTTHLILIIIRKKKCILQMRHHSFFFFSQTQCHSLISFIFAKVSEDQRSIICLDTTNQENLPLNCINFLYSLYLQNFKR